MLADAARRRVVGADLLEHGADVRRRLPRRARRAGLAAEVEERLRGEAEHVGARVDAHLRRRLGDLLVEAEVVELALERRELAVAEVLGQHGREAARRPGDDDLAAVPGYELGAELAEHGVELDDEVRRLVRRRARAAAAGARRLLLRLALFFRRAVAGRLGLGLLLRPRALRRLLLLAVLGLAVG